MKPVSLPRWGFCLFSALAAIGAVGCRSGSRDDASVRLINAAPQTQDLSVSVDGQCVWRHAAFRSDTGFQGVGEGTFEVSIEALMNGKKRTGSNYLLSRKGEAYTVVALDPTQSGEPPDLRIFSDDRTAPIPPGKVRLHFIDAGDGVGPVDVLFNNIVGFTDVPFAARSSALLLDPGVYDLRVNAAEDVRSLTNPLRVRFLPGQAYTLVAMGRGAGPGAAGLSLQVYPDQP